jgi:hypothetical protein
MVTVWLPAAAFGSALSVSTLVPEPGAASVSAEKLAVSATAELNALSTLTPNLQFCSVLGLP